MTGALRSKKLKEYYDLVELPTSTKALLDWMTGTIQINDKSEETYSFFQKKEGAPPNAVLDALVHECIHAWQISICGYLYQLVFLVQNSVANQLSGMDSYDQYYKLLEGDIDSSVFDAVIKSLNTKGSDGISALGILESSTICLQYRESFDHNAKDFVDFLKGNHFPEEYRLFEKFFTAMDGDEKSIFLFPIICHYSLNSNNPSRLFPILAKQCVERNFDLQTMTVEYDKFCREKDDSVWGYSWEPRVPILDEVAPTNGMDVEPKPIPEVKNFGRLRDEIMSSENRDELIGRFFICADTIDYNDLVGKAMDYILLSPLDDVDAEGHRVWPIARFKGKASQSVMLAMAASRKLLGRVTTTLYQSGETFVYQGPIDDF